MAEQAPADVDARPRLDPPSGSRSALAAVLGIAGALLWPLALWGQYDAREYVGVFLGSAIVIVLGVVLVIARGTRTLGTAMLAGGLPVASAQVWWLFTDSFAGDWAVVASSAMLTAGGLVAASARRDPAMDRVAQAHRVAQALGARERRCAPVVQRAGRPLSR